MSKFSHLKEITNIGDCVVGRLYIVDNLKEQQNAPAAYREICVSEATSIVQEDDAEYNEMDEATVFLNDQVQLGVEHTIVGYEWSIGQSELVDFYSMYEVSQEEYPEYFL